MTNPTVRIHDLSTGQEIEREMNEEELAFYEGNIAAAEVKKAEELANQEAKTALLKRLGITEDEAKLLLG